MSSASAATPPSQLKWHDNTKDTDERHVTAHCYYLVMIPVLAAVWGPLGVEYSQADWQVTACWVGCPDPQVGPGQVLANLTTNQRHGSSHFPYSLMWTVNTKGLGLHQTHQFWSSYRVINWFCLFRTCPRPLLASVPTVGIITGVTCSRPMFHTQLGPLTRTHLWVMQRPCPMQGYLLRRLVLALQSSHLISVEWQVLGAPGPVKTNHNWGSSRRRFKN